VADEITTSDGERLEAEWAVPPRPRAGAVLCHPHPEHGGTMRSMVISALFGALPDVGITCLRFNFRGVEGSTGVHASGDGEQLDVEAAVHELDAAMDPDLPLLVAGWSFGADLALSVTAPRISGWIAIAPPLGSGDPGRAGVDPRPKLVLLAERDEIRDPNAVMPVLAGWTNTEAETIAGASHFFVGRADRVVDCAIAFVDRLETQSSGSGG